EHLQGHAAYDSRRSTNLMTKPQFPFLQKVAAAAPAKPANPLLAGHKADQQSEGQKAELEARVAKAAEAEATELSDEEKNQKLVPTGLDQLAKMTTADAEIEQALESTEAPQIAFDFQGRLDEIDRL